MHAPKHQRRCETRGVDKRRSEYSCAIKILEETERVGGRGCKSVGGDNGNEQVTKVILFPLWANEILQKQ